MGVSASLPARAIGAAAPGDVHGHGGGRGPAVIKYIGSKRTLVPVILEAISQAAGARSVIDLFSGTSRVGHALKAAGYQVFANDHNAYAATLARCYVQADAEDVLPAAQRLIGELNALLSPLGLTYARYEALSVLLDAAGGEMPYAASLRDERLGRVSRQGALFA